MSALGAVFVVGLIVLPFALDLFWVPCICRWLLPGECCPRHGELPGD